MGLIEKIEEIRKKPDQIKMRYVWILVLICLPVILLIWFFSIKNDLGESSERKSNLKQSTNEIQKSGADLLREIEKQKENMQNAESSLQSEMNSGQNQ